jgi:uncharacterized membrane protein
MPFGNVIAQTMIVSARAAVGNQKSRCRMGVLGCIQKIARMLATSNAQLLHRSRASKPMKKEKKINNKIGRSVTIRQIK